MTTVLAWPAASALAGVLALAALSAWMLQRMLALDSPRSPHGKALGVACYACVPLQYGLVVGAPAAAPVVLPLVATLALPLVAVLGGDLASLGERLARRGHAVMLSVYALSFTAMAGRNAVLVVASAVAGSLVLDALRALLRRRRSRRWSRLRVAVALLGSAVATGAGGATLAPLAQPWVGAALVALTAAPCGALGTLVLEGMAHDCATPAPRCGVPLRLEAVAFAAPLVWALGM